MSDDARRELLARVAHAPEGVRDDDPAAAHARVARDYRHEGAMGLDERLDRLEERLVDYGVDVVRTRQAQLADAIATELARRRARRVVAPPGLPDAWRAGPCGSGSATWPN